MVRHLIDNIEKKNFLFMFTQSYKKDFYQLNKIKIEIVKSELYILSSTRSCIYQAGHKYTDWGESKHIILVTLPPGVSQYGHNIPLRADINMNSYITLRSLIRTHITCNITHTLHVGSH